MGPDSPLHIEYIGRLKIARSSICTDGVAVTKSYFYANNFNVGLKNIMCQIITEKSSDTKIYGVFPDCPNPVR